MKIISYNNLKVNRYLINVLYYGDYNFKIVKLNILLYQIKNIFYCLTKDEILEKMEEYIIEHDLFKTASIITPNDKDFNLFNYKHTKPYLRDYKINKILYEQKR